MRQVWSFTTLLAAATAACGGGGGGGDGSPDSGAAEDGAVPPDASASGDRFLFCSARSGNFEIYRHEDGDVTQLTDDPSRDAWWPRVSPDHERILFYRSEVADRPETGGWDNNYEHAALWIMDADGGAARELLTLEGQGWSAQGVANWSPDGENLVMVARDADTGRWELHIMKVDVTGPVKVSQRDSFYVDPSWSPVGDKIVFAAFPPDAVGLDLAQLEVYVADLDGSNEVRLTDDDVRDHDPSWSPDGTSIVFESEMDPEAFRWALRTVSIPGGEVATLLDDGNINTLGRFAPDGGMTFHRFILGGEGTWRISHIRRDGTGLRDLTDGSHEDVDADPY